MALDLCKKNFLVPASTSFLAASKTTVIAIFADVKQIHDQVWVRMKAAVEELGSSLGTEEYSHQDFTLEFGF